MSSDCSEGLSDREIAVRLFLSPLTAKTHLTQHLRQNLSLQVDQEAARHIKPSGKPGTGHLEVYTLWAFACKPTAREIEAGHQRREDAEALVRNPSPNLIAMRRREESLRVGTEEARREAEQILRAIVRSGGLTGGEAQALLDR